MGETIELTASDGHNLSAYRADPDGTLKAGVVILQEIFGVTNHIQAVADEYAARGYLAIAPAMFDRIQPGVTLDYTAIEQGRGLMMQLNLDNAAQDMAAAASVARTAGKVAVIGYCWGGAMADLAACRINIDAAVAYYGRMIVEWLDHETSLPGDVSLRRNRPADSRRDDRADQSSPSGWRIPHVSRCGTRL